MTKIEVGKGKDALIPMENANLANSGLEKKADQVGNNERNLTSHASRWLIFNTLAVLTSIIVWFISVEDTNPLRTMVLSFLIGSLFIESKLYASKQPNNILEYLMLFGIMALIDGYELFRMEAMEIGQLMFFSGRAVIIFLSMAGAIAANFKKTAERWHSTVGAVLGSLIGMVVFGMVNRAVLAIRMKNYPQSPFYPIESIPAIPTSML
ncbi:hypothetical protein GCK72_008675 [Caenorhabditis remanei]|uniref:Uncharacterized protein n=1 Tax=Caenorhabditis remanei TaxID=31234 RepID=A0A6A5H0W6_CAERE|nr:hypothetical protein GCK72_008675 [Caenorhabditis remanei]KAF1760426.1 hypothetical protein GCK72_008675 [Caenorhabditis remanei]